NGGRNILDGKMEKPDDGLRKIADETGGGYTELLWTDDLDAGFRRVAEELHSQYVIGFTPEKVDGKVHKLDVRVNVPGLTVRTRKSYVAG
ncbi:MAG: VWA domain-containing protein, partial [Acidobacteria bacterium]|nr:VWA domain-containing protein [Acidobacteriota bacterium]